jgi:hypothetical protein
MAFKKGQSGNPKGRPKGALNKATLAAQHLLDGEAEEITRKVIDLAKQGNPMALKCCLERLLPRRKDRPISLNLPKVKTQADVPQALRAILAAVSRGDITPSEADILAGLVEATHKAISQQPPEPHKGTIPKECFRDRGVRNAYLQVMAAIRESYEKHQNSSKHPRLAESAASQSLSSVSKETGATESQPEGEEKDEPSPPSSPLLSGQDAEPC